MEKHQETLGLPNNFEKFELARKKIHQKEIRNVLESMSEMQIAELIGFAKDEVENTLQDFKLDIENTKSYMKNGSFSPSSSYILSEKGENLGQLQESRSKNNAKLLSNDLEKIYLMKKKYQKILDGFDDINILDVLEDLNNGTFSDSSRFLVENEFLIKKAFFYSVQRDQHFVDQNINEPVSLDENTADQKTNFSAQEARETLSLKHFSTSQYYAFEEILTRLEKNKLNIK